MAGARSPEQVGDNTLAAQLAEIDAIGRILTDNLDDNQIMWNW